MFGTYLLTVHQPHVRCAPAGLDGLRKVTEAFTSLYWLWIIVGAAIAITRPGVQCSCACRFWRTVTAFACLLHSEGKELSRVCYFQNAPVIVIP